MAILIEDPQLEALAYRVASLRGVSVKEIIRDSLFSLATQKTLHVEQPSLRERLTKLASEVDKIPPKNPIDHRTAEEVLGYDENGIW